MVSYDDIIKSHKRISDFIRHTPCEHSKTLSSLLGVDVFIKFENLQFTAAFKERGALNKLLCLQEQGDPIHGVIAMSAGNHAKGVAYHASRLGIPSTIVMPTATPLVKVNDTKALGATVILFGDTLDQASDHALVLAEQQQYIFIHPYDDAEVIAGQGTAAIEMLVDQPDLDVLLVPIGGGGLIAGMSIAAKTINPDIKVVGVQAASYAAAKQMSLGQPVAVGGNTIAEGIAVKHPGKNAIAIIDQYVDEIITVTEQSLERAVSLYVNIEKSVSEGAGAASLAAVVEHAPHFAGKKVGLVLSGANIDTKLLANILLRDLACSGRLVRIRIMLDDRPGLLSLVTALVAEQGGNIVSVNHQRVFASVSARETVLELEVEVREKKDSQKMIRVLSEAGFNAEIV